LGALPANSRIAKATLRLYVSAVLAPGSFDVYQLQNNWNERGVSFNSAPQLGPSATGGHPVLVTAASVNQFVLVDITPLAQSWLNGSVPNNGVAIALTGVNGSFSFDSKESTGTGHHPELEVVFASSAAPTVAAEPTAISPATANQAGVKGAPDVYIDNGTALQVGANFNIDGNGTAAGFNATSQYSLSGVPVLSAPGNSSLFIGPGAGQNNNGAAANLFIGTNAGQASTTGGYNTFVGTVAGQKNTTGIVNTFVGANSGFSNTTATANSFFGISSGYNTTSGNWNTFLGANAGYSNTTGDSNVFVGVQAGVLAGAGSRNTYLGSDAGLSNNGSDNVMVGSESGTALTNGNSNTFVGANSGLVTVTGSNNTFVGFNAGSAANASGSNNVYVASPGQGSDSGAIRIGDPSSQSSAYMAGISGSSTSSGVPVFVDSSGKLGTGGGTVNFTQVAGTLSSPQFTGTYANQVTLSNTTNVFDGNFVGNGSGLTGVTSGSSWPIVIKTADYSIQTSDFSTPTTYGNSLLLTGSTAHTFTLPNPAPPNGGCVAVSNFASAPVNSGTNVFLTVSGNGLTIDGSAPNATQPKRNSYLYCSDGTNYWRINRQTAGPSEIGPFLYTVDTGTVDLLKTTFVAGLDLGLNTGTTIFLLPKFANTSGTPTLDVNGLGAKKILRYGNKPLAPGDLSTTALAVVIYDGTFWELINPQTIAGTVTAVTATAPLVSSGGVTPNISCPTCITTAALTGTTGSIGGSALTAGTCTTGTASVTGAVVGHPVAVSASDGSLPNGFVILSAAVTSTNTVTVQLCATASVTPVPKAYNVTTQ
jgi:hypothetical protein